MNDQDIVRGRANVIRPPGNGDALPEHRQKQVEAGLAQYQAVLAERDELQRKLRDATVKIEGMQVQLDAIQGVVNLMESTVQTCQLQRDEAVVRSARLATTLENIFSLLATEIGNIDHGGHEDGVAPEQMP